MLTLSLQELQLHEDDLEVVKPGRHFFAVKEACQGMEVLRLRRLRPRDARGRVRITGLLGAFGSGKDCTVRTALGAVEVVMTPEGLALREYPVDEMVQEAMALEQALERGGAHAH